MNSGDSPAASNNERPLQSVKNPASSAGIGMMATMRSSICPLEQNVHSTLKAQEQHLLLSDEVSDVLIRYCHM